jgi:phosphatidylserine/phosphatidylglycerophosphate/cardiolipin synthase-like enzyme
MPCNERDRVSAAAGVPIWIDAEARIAHAKTMAIDEAVTLTGSYNWTPGAAARSENLNLVSSPAIATAYAARWLPSSGVVASCTLRRRVPTRVRYDSPLEGDGFELSVPRERGDRFDLSLLFMSLKPSAF